MGARVLVVYGTHHGATRGIAERIALILGASGHEATVERVERAAERGSLEQWDAFVVGSATYGFHWLKEVTRFVRQQHRLLARRPVWLFSSGPLGTELTHAAGHDVRADPRELHEFRRAIHPRDHRVFFGAYDPGAKPIGLIERITRLMPAAREALPAGDFRDWDEIEDWARGIGAELQALHASARVLGDRATGPAGVPPQRV
jgi:menaquinone-dependent protoporphyrinogen oxidase